MGRKWIGIELGEHCYTHCKPRLDKVIDGEQGGISKAVNWQGGGGYKFYELAPSLCKKDKYGQWIIDSDKYNSDMLIIQNDDIDYNVCSDLVYKLIGQLKAHLKGYLKSDDDVEKVLRQFKVNIADNIYAQMKSHFFHEDVAYSISTMRPFSKIETGFGGKYISNQIYDYRASMSPSEVPKRIFKGFTKSCHTMYKFDSNTERVFAIVLENDDEVLRWLCPNINQFNIYYDRNSGSRYQPDFVVETKDIIYMVETKDARKVNGDIDDVVLAKSKAAMKYCSEATEYNAQNGGSGTMP